MELSYSSSFNEISTSESFMINGGVSWTDLSLGLLYGVSALIVGAVIATTAVAGIIVGGILFEAGFLFSLYTYTLIYDKICSH